MNPRWVASTVLVVALAVASCHSEPFGNPFIGAIGPLVPGLEERLTYADTNEDGESFRAAVPYWSSDGTGILYSFSPREYGPGELKGALRCILNHVCRPAAADPLDACLAMLPPTGGSAYWNVCESRAGHSFVTDSIGAGNINQLGQLLYTEKSIKAVAPQFYAFQPPPLPADLGTELWLATPQAPLTRRLIPNGGLLSSIQWSGPATFVALAGASLVQGTITPDSAAIVGVAGVGVVLNYALVDGGGGAMFVGGDLSIRHATIPGGVVTVVATLPLGPGGQLLDIGCHPDLCIALASSGGTPGTWNLWKINVATGSSAIVRTYTHPITSAKLSPVSGDVVALEGVNVYLLVGVVP